MDETGQICSKERRKFQESIQSLRFYGRSRRSFKEKEGYMIEVRKGEPTKCQRFCDVAKFCTQYQDEIKAIGEESGSK